MKAYSKIVVELSMEQRQKLEEEKARTGKTMKAILIEALELYFKQKGEKLDR